MTFNEMNNEIPPHLDEEDILSCIVTLGSPINGGDTNYYDGFKSNRFGAKKFRYHLNIINYKFGVIGQFVMVFILEMVTE